MYKFVFVLLFSIWERVVTCMWVRYDHDGSLILRRLDELLFVSFWATPSLVAASKPFVLFLPIPRAYYLLPGISALVISRDQHKTHLQARLPSTIQLQEYAKPSPSSSSSPSSSRYPLLSRKQKSAVVKMTQFKRTFRCSNNCISGFLDSLGFLANLRDSDKSLLKFLKLRSEAHTEVFRHFSSPLKMSSQSYG